MGGLGERADIITLPKSIGSVIPYVTSSTKLVLGIYVLPKHYWNLARSDEGKTESS